MDFTKIFLAGMGTYLTPCVYPLIPIYLSSLLGGNIGDGEKIQRGQLMSRAIFFSFGFILVFSIMGLGAAGIGGFLQDHKTAFQIAGGVLVLIFGLKFLGVIQIPFMDRVVRKDDSKLQGKMGVFSAFLMGFFFAAGWSPCIGPILGSVLTYTASKTGDPMMGLLYLSTYGLGFAVPLLITAFFAESGVGFIQRTSRFLPTFEKIIGAVLIVTSLYFFSGIGGSGVPCMHEANDPTRPNGKPIMVEFYSENCTICQRMAPTIEGLMTTCNGKNVDIRLVDISKPEYRYFKKKYRLLGVPTFVFIDKAGGEVSRLIGEQTEQTLLQQLSVMIGEQCPGVGPLPDDFPTVMPTQKQKSSTPSHKGATCKGDNTSGVPLCTE